ncbi:MAG: succinate dehydrogenase cytochrome b subunit [Verrucomicrobiales bacterium]
MTFSPLRQFARFYASSVGKKYVVALTAIGLLGFLPVHVIGNLLIFDQTRVALNEYAHFLHTFGHGAVVWAFRFGLLAMFLIHVVATIQLARQNRAARGPDAYAVKTPQASTAGSRTMIISGLIILSFVVFHILHYTVRVSPAYKALPLFDLDGKKVFDVYSMVVMGFQYWPSTIFYIIGVTLLCLHLSHGVASVFQTLGLRTRKSADLIMVVGRGYALFVWAGFLSVPLAVAFGFVK